MATIGSLALDLKAKATSFNQTLKGAGASLKRFTKSIGPMMGRLAKFGALAGGAAVVGLSALVVKQLAAIDSAGKYAKQVGISTESLTKLQFAASQAGVETTTMRKSMQNATKVIADAARGSKTAVEAFENMGVSVEDLKDLKPDEQLKAIADGMSQMTNQTEKTSAAVLLFGARGAGMINMLDQGSAGLEAMGEEAKRLGAVLTDEDAFKAAEAIDAMDKMKKAIGGVINTLAVELAPFIKAAADAITAWLSDGASAGEKMEGVIGSLIKGSAILADIWQALRGAVNAVGGALFKVLELSMVPLNVLIQNVGGLLDMLGLLPDAADEFIQTLSDAENVLGAAADEMFASSGAAFGSIGDASDQAEKFLMSIKRAADARAKEATAGKEQVNNMAQLAQLSGEHAANVQDAADALGSGKIAAPEQASQIAEDVRMTREAIAKAPPLWKRVAEEIAKAKTGTVEAVKQMNRASIQATLSLRQQVIELRSEVRAQEERLAAATSGIAGD